MILQADCNGSTVYYKGKCTDALEYCVAHGFDGFDGSSVCTGGEEGGLSQSIEEVITGAAKSPAEDYFDGFVLGVTKGRYLFDVRTPHSKRKSPNKM